MYGAHRHFILLAGMAALAGYCTGCGAPEETRLPVEGTVMLGNQPLTTGTVILRPDAGKGNTSKHEPRGTIDGSGKYLVVTSSGQAGSKPGAAPGWYKVGVVAAVAKDAKNPYALAKSLVPAKYNDPDQSGIFLEVVNNAPPGAFDIKLDAK